MPLPLAVPLVLGGAQLVNQGILAYRQKQKANELRNRGPLDPTPNAFRAAQMGLENQANNSQVAGYDQEVENLNEGVASTIGEAKKSGISSSNVMNVLTRVNQQKQRALRTLSAAGQNEQRLRKDRAINAQMQRGQYQELGRQENNEAIGALEGASIQNVNNVLSGGVGLLSSLDTGGAPGGTPDQMDTMTPSVQTGSLSPTPAPQRVAVDGGPIDLTNPQIPPSLSERPMQQYKNDPYLEYLRSKRLSTTRY